MAIYHFHASKGSRQGGQSASAAAAYMTRQGKYSRHHEAATVVWSGNMPSWAQSDPMAYWRAADQHERKNARLFRSYEFSLPKELDESQQAVLAQEFCRHVAAAEEGSLPYTFVIHPGKGTNPHVHLLISERVNDGVDRNPETWFKRAAKEAAAGGARKATSLERKGHLLELRAAWAEAANVALAAAGHEARIDHRSLADQGRDEEPSLHMGPHVMAMERRGISTRKKAEAEAKRRRREEKARKEAEAAAEAQERARREDMDRTMQAALEQARALGCEAYEIGIRGEKGMIRKEYTLAQLKTAIPYLKAQNAQGQDIYIRPAESTQAALVLVDDLPASTVTKMRQSGYAPAAVVETSPGNHQVWVRLDSTTATMPSEERKKAAALLCEWSHGDPGSVDARHFGRLAGFTNRKEKHRLPDGRAPFCLLQEATGEAAAKGADMRRYVSAFLRKAARDANKAARATKKTAQGTQVDSVQSAQTGYFTPARPSGTLSIDEAYKVFMEAWQKWESRQTGKPDLSQGDFYCACMLLEAGADISTTATAIGARSPKVYLRHRDSPAYARRTAEAAAKKIGYVEPEREEEVQEEERSAPTPR